ncbi:MAG: dethiobiotin synthase [Rickettsiaceae bacterium]|nr:dethiobiotin synthase [Rickettsiaceae bacterium]
MKLFITGTDTNVGKTHISVCLLEEFNKIGLATLGMKPLASGCRTENDMLINQDAVDLMKASSVKVGYHRVNPFSFEQAIAPHIAAKQENYLLTKKKIKLAILRMLKIPSDVTIIEGVGGWHTPINEHELMSDVINSMKLPVILVVGLKLGCLNHSILTALAIKEAKLPFIGWIGNYIDPNMQARRENIDSLKSLLMAPCLGIVPYGHKFDQLNLEPIFRYFL